MAKRKKKELPPIALSKKREAKAQHLDSLDPPNHNKVLSDIFSLRVRDEETDKVLLAFVDPKYKAEHIVDMGPEYPSWMDPRVFVRMLRKDEGIMKAIHRIIQTKNWKLFNALDVEVQRVFKEAYIPYMLKRFDSVRRLFSRWATANEVFDQQEPKVTGAACWPWRKKDTTARKADERTKKADRVTPASSSPPSKASSTSSPKKPKVEKAQSHSPPETKPSQDPEEIGPLRITRSLLKSRRQNVLRR